MDIEPKLGRSYILDKLYKLIFIILLWTEKVKREKRQLIRRLTRMDLEKADYSYVKDIVKRTFDAQMAPALICEAGSSFYRVRRNPHSKPEKVKDLREPPASKVVGFQRCNPPKKPIFYASNRLLTAALEVDILEGDIVYLTKWNLNRPMHINVGVSSTYYEDNDGINRLIPESSKEIIDFFELLFTRKIHETFSHDYKITSAISEMLTAEHTPQRDGSEFRSSGGHIALTYKSVVDRTVVGTEEGENFSFHPKLVDEFMSLTEIIEAQVTSRNGMDFCLEIRDFSNTIDDEEINWSNDPTSVSFSNVLTNGFGSYEGFTWTTATSNATLI